MLRTTASKPVMHGGPVSRLAWLAVLFGQMVASGCGRDRSEAQRLLNQATESYQQLGPGLAELQGRLPALHDEVEKLAAVLPAGGDLRARYFTTEEILGVLDGKLKWLSGEIAVAKQSPRMERALAIRDTLARTRDELGEVGKSVVEIVHESSRLQRVLALVKAPDRFGAFHEVLATGVEIRGADDGAEAGLMSRIENPGRKTGWVDLDRVFFVGRSDAIDVPASRAQLDNVAQILKAHPSVRLEIGGYGGQAPVEGRFSEQRARAVVQALGQMGVAPWRLRAIAAPAAIGTAHEGIGLRVWAK
jgi:hypothetical protein